MTSLKTPFIWDLFMESKLKRNSNGSCRSAAQLKSNPITRRYNTLVCCCQTKENILFCLAGILQWDCINLIFINLFKTVVLNHRYECLFMVWLTTTCSNGSDLWKRQGFLWGGTFYWTNRIVGRDFRQAFRNKVPFLRPKTFRKRSRTFLRPEIYFMPKAV